MPDRRPRTARPARPWIRLSALATTLGLLTGCTNLATSPDTAPTGQESGAGLFDDTVVHDLDIELDQEAYDAMIDTFTSTGDKEWITATVTVDGQEIRDVGLRLKGNSSLSGLRGGGAGGDGAAAEDAGAAGDAADDQAADATGDRQQRGGPGGGPAGGATADEPESLPWLVRLDKFVAGQSYEGLTEFVIRSNSSETSLNEAVALELVGLAGLATQEAASTRLSVNDSEEQLRLLVENPGEEWDERTFDADGILYKAEAGGDYSYRGDDPAAYVDVFDQESGGTEDLTPLMDFLEFVNDADDATFAAELGTHLDVAAFADYLAVQELIANQDDIDGPGNNSYLRYDSTTGRFTVVTWDLNLAFGGLGGGGFGGGGFGGGERPDGAGAPPAGELPDGWEPPTGDLPEGRVPPADGDGAGPSTDELRAAFPGGGPGGGPGGSNVLVERFLATPAFAQEYETSLTELRAALYSSGEAQAVLDRWSTLLTEDAADLVDADVVAEEAAAIAAHFTEQTAPGPEPTASSEA
jgi:spore coat protein CotH